jgi:hypothetical protein
MEQELWKRLGLRREDLADRPHREVADYLLFIQLINREEQAAQNRKNRPSRR